MAKTPAVGKKAAKTPKKAGKSTKRSKRVESYRYAFFEPRARRGAGRWRLPALPCAAPTDQPDCARHTLWRRR